jgi:hypothetical protein
MCVIYIAFNIKHDYDENSLFLRVNKVSISEATVRVVLCLVHRTCSIVYHLGLFKYTQSRSLISVRKGTFFCYFLRLRLVVPFICFIPLFIKNISLCASTEEIFRVTNKGKKEVKFTIEEAMKAQTGSSSISLLFL